MAANVVPLQARKNRLEPAIFPASLHAVSAIFNPANASAIIPLSAPAALEVGMMLDYASPPFATPPTIIEIIDSTHVKVNQPATANSGPDTKFAIGPSLPSISGRTLHLFKNNFTPDVNTVLADLTEADFTGYSAKLLTMTSGYVDVTGTPYDESGLVSFLATGSAVANTIYGWWIDDGTNILLTGLLNAPVGIAGAGQQIAGIVRDSFPPKYGFVQVTP